MKGSIEPKEPKEKELLEYLYGKACDIADYCHRNGITVPTSISVHPDYKPHDTAYDYLYVSFSEDYESGNTKRIVSLHYNAYEDKAEYHESLYEDKK